MAVRLNRAIFSAENVIALLTKTPPLQSLVLDLSFTAITGPELLRIVQQLVSKKPRRMQLRVDCCKGIDGESLCQAVKACAGEDWHIGFSGLTGERVEAIQKYMRARGRLLLMAAAAELNYKGFGAEIMEAIG